MSVLITGYKANDNKDKTFRYLKVYIHSVISNPRGDAAGTFTNEVDADPSCEKDLRGATFPLEVEPEFSLQNKEGKYGGQVAAVTLKSFKIVPRRPLSS